MPTRVMKYYQGTTIYAFIGASIAFLMKTIDAVYSSTPFQWLLDIHLDWSSTFLKIIEAIVTAAIGGIIGVLLKRLSNDIYDWLKPRFISATISRMNKIKLYIKSKFKENGKDNTDIGEHQ